jgi:Zn-dependent protease
VAAGLVFRFVVVERIRSGFYGGELPWGSEALFSLGALNVVLATFNLIPLPPLDGSAVVERLLPARLWPGYLRLRQYSMGVLLVIVFLLPGVLDTVFGWTLDLWRQLLV